MLARWAFAAMALSSGSGAWGVSRAPSGAGLDLSFPQAGYDAFDSGHVPSTLPDSPPTAIFDVPVISKFFSVPDSVSDPTPVIVGQPIADVSGNTIWALGFATSSASNFSLLLVSAGRLGGFCWNMSLPGTWDLDVTSSVAPVRLGLLGPRKDRLGVFVCPKSSSSRRNLSFSLLTGLPASGPKQANSSCVQSAPRLVNTTTLPSELPLSKFNPLVLPDYTSVALLDQVPLAGPALSVFSISGDHWTVERRLVGFSPVESLALLSNSSTLFAFSGTTQVFQASFDELPIANMSATPTNDPKSIQSFFVGVNPHVFSLPPHNGSEPSLVGAISDSGIFMFSGRPMAPTWSRTNADLAQNQGTLRFAGLLARSNSLQMSGSASEKTAAESLSAADSTLALFCQDIQNGYGSLIGLDPATGKTLWDGSFSTASITTLLPRNLPKRVPCSQAVGGIVTTQDRSLVTAMGPLNLLMALRFPVNHGSGLPSLLYAVPITPSGAPASASPPFSISPILTPLTLMTGFTTFQVARTLDGAGSDPYPGTSDSSSSSLPAVAIVFITLGSIVTLLCLCAFCFLFGRTLKRRQEDRRLKHRAVGKVTTASELARQTYPSPLGPKVSGSPMVGRPSVLAPAMAATPSRSADPKTPLQTPRLRTASGLSPGRLVPAPMSPKLYESLAERMGLFTGRPEDYPRTPGVTIAQSVKSGETFGSMTFMRNAKGAPAVIPAEHVHSRDPRSFMEHASSASHREPTSTNILANFAAPGPAGAGRDPALAADGMIPEALQFGAGAAAGAALGHKDPSTGRRSKKSKVSGSSDPRSKPELAFPYSPAAAPAPDFSGVCYDPGEPTHDVELAAGPDAGPDAGAGGARVLERVGPRRAGGAAGTPADWTSSLHLSSGFVPAPSGGLAFAVPAGARLSVSSQMSAGLDMRRDSTLSASPDGDDLAYYLGAGLSDGAGFEHGRQDAPGEIPHVANRRYADGRRGDYDIDRRPSAGNGRRESFGHYDIDRRPSAKDGRRDSSGAGYDSDGGASTSTARGRRLSRPLARQDTVTPRPAAPASPALLPGGGPARRSWADNIAQFAQDLRGEPEETEEERGGVGGHPGLAGRARSGERASQHSTLHSTSGSEGYLTAEEGYDRSTISK